MLIKVPPEIQIKSTIKPGSVYYFPEDALTSEEPHYFIVINQKADDDVILLVCASSQIEGVKRRRRHLPGTVVVIKQNQYSGFSHDSIVDCNTVFLRRIDHLVSKLEQGKLKVKPDMDIMIVEKLRKAMMRSPMVEADKKRLVSPW